MSKKNTTGIPPGFHTVVPSLSFKDAAKALEFYKKAFGAAELMRMAGPEGRILHAEMKIGDSVFFLNDEMAGMPEFPKSPETLKGSSGGNNLYVPDCDALYNSAVAAGAKALIPLSDQFWGDRHGVIKDPFGYVWGILTRQEDLTPEEIQARMKAYEAAQKK